jgi:hypothetical protein
MGDLDGCASDDGARTAENEDDGDDRDDGGVGACRADSMRRGDQATNLTSGQ